MAVSSWFSNVPYNNVDNQLGDGVDYILCFYNTIPFSAVQKTRYGLYNCLF